MAVNNLHIDVEDSAGTRLGAGPITSAATWSYTARMDAAGDFSFTMPASDPKAALIQKKRIVRAYAMLNDNRLEVGAGIIDVIEREPQEDGSVLLHVSGGDLIRELNYRSVLGLKLYTGGNPVTHAAAVAAVGAYAPVGWSFVADPSPPSNSVYGYFNGDSVLAGLIKTSEKSQTHFYRGVGRQLIFASAFAASGVRAIQAKGDLTAATCAITSLVERVELYDLITRIYPRGSGNAEAQLTLRATTRVAPAGYTLNKTANYIEHNASTAAYGRIERQVDFREIGPVENTTPDVISAANMLFDTGLEYLKRSSVELEQATYSVDLASCSALLRPMQTIRVVYRDLDAGLDINTDLNILEATWEITQDEIGTTAIVVSNADAWPASDQRALVGTIAEGRVYQALPQLNANSYVTAYNKNIDEDNIAAFRFRFGKEVTQLQSVLFEFQILPFESTIKTIGTTSGGSGETSTGAPDINTSGNPSNNTSGASNGPTGAASGNTGNASGNTGAASGSTGNTTGATSDETGATNSIGGGTNSPTGATNLIGGGTNSPTGGTNLVGGGTNSPTGATNSPSGSTGDESLVTDLPDGEDTIGGGQHDHALQINNVFSAAGLQTVYFESGSPPRLAAVLGGSTQFVRVNASGSHQHFVNAHSHTVSAHSHSVNAHSHTVNAHEHTVDAHSHSVNAHEHTVDAHSHTVNAHGHTVNVHSHTVNAHDHTVDAHSHTVDAHAHTLNNHSHDLNNHTHSLNNHFHSLNNHVHDLEGGLSAIYGIYRAALSQTFTVEDLEYRVNSGAWLAASTSVNVANGWRRLDISALVTHPDTFRPLQENNLLEIRALGAAATYSILSWSGYAADSILRVSVSAPGGMGIVVGDIIDIIGASIGHGGTIVNATDYAVLAIDATAPTYSIDVGRDWLADENSQAGGGTVRVHGTATIDAQLSVRNIIQAIAYI